MTSLTRSSCKHILIITLDWLLNIRSHTVLSLLYPEFNTIYLSSPSSHCYLHLRQNMDVVSAFSASVMSLLAILIKYIVTSPQDTIFGGKNPEKSNSA